MVKSPLTLSSKVRIKEKLLTSKIIELYKTDFNIDVSAYFHNIPEVSIFECIESGLLFYAPTGLAGNENFYDQLKSSMPLMYGQPYYPPWKWEYEIAQRLINPSDNVYEIGAGNGAFLLSLMQNGTTLVSGSELNEDSIRSALSKGVNLEYKTIEQKAIDHAEVYDVVCTFQVLEHVENVRDFLAAAIKILKTGGRLIIAVPFNNPYLFGKDKWNTLNLPPHHMQLWNKKAFESLPKFFGLKLVQTIIEPLASEGYDFDQFVKINKQSFYPDALPFAGKVHSLYRKWVSKNLSQLKGKNIVVVYEKI